MLAQPNDIDIISEKITTLNSKQSSIEDVEIEDYLAHKPLNLRVTLDNAEAYTGADYVIIAPPPTDYDPETNFHRDRWLYRQTSRKPRRPTPPPLRAGERSGRGGGARHHFLPRIPARRPHLM